MIRRFVKTSATGQRKAQPGRADGKQARKGVENCEEAARIRRRPKRKPTVARAALCRSSLLRLLQLKTGIPRLRFHRHLSWLPRRHGDWYEVTQFKQGITSHPIYAGPCAAYHICRHKYFARGDDRSKYPFAIDSYNAEKQLHLSCDRRGSGASKRGYADSNLLFRLRDGG